MLKLAILRGFLAKHICPMPGPNLGTNAELGDLWDRKPDARQKRYQQDGERSEQLGTGGHGPQQVEPQMDSNGHG